MLLNAAVRVAAWLESALPEPGCRSELAPIFIIGPPRSGTTLLYQLLVARFRVCYFDNLSARFHRAPVLPAGLGGRFAPGRRGYDSDHGRTSGWRGPSECGDLWYRWFPRGESVYVAPGATPDDHLRALRRTLFQVAGLAGCPLVVKNTFNSMRIAPILEAVPEAVFLVATRDPVDTAQSILRGRLRVHGTKDRWWSLPPRQAAELRRLAPCAQVVDQVFWTYAQIEEDMERFGRGRFHSVAYARLCEEPRKVLAEIEAFLVRAGRAMRVRGEVPARFPVSTGRKVDDDDFRCIVARVKERWGTTEATLP